MSTINLEKELIRRNQATLAKERKLIDDQAKIDALVDNMLQVADDKYRDELLGTLGFDYKIREAQEVRKEREQFKHLPAERIFDIAAIKATCIEFGLRCLPTRHFKGQLDSQLGAKLEELKRLCGGKLPKVDWEEDLSPTRLAVFSAGFWPVPFETPVAPKRMGYPATQFFICAPADQFILQDKPKDPLLFCRLNADKFFLMHKWGDDLETAHLRVGQTTESNWNSVYKPDDESGSPKNQAEQSIKPSVVNHAYFQRKADLKRHQDENFAKLNAAKPKGIFHSFFNGKSES